jgi:cell division protein FtsZ
MAAKDEDIKKAIVTIKVIGVGGGGNSVLLRMAKNNFLDIELIAVNTDAKQLEIMKDAGIKPLQIGDSLTRGRGTGGRLDVGEQAAKADENRLKEAMQGADLIFVTAGMGGGAGTGAAPVVAHIARGLGILTVGVVTMPFTFEGARKKRLANEGVVKLQANMDALIAVQNDNLLKLPENRHMSLVQAFHEADEILRRAIRCIAELILTTGVINVDFADVTSIFRQSQSSDALLGIGESDADGGAVQAVQRAIASPLIDKSLEGARGIILNISGNESLTLYEVTKATQYIYDNTHPEVNIILGTVIDKELGDKVRATIIATDFIDGTVIQSANMEVPQSKLSAQSNLEPPHFLNNKAGEVPEFKHGSFSIPSFQRPDEKKK